jgi:hypothetical protein
MKRITLFLFAAMMIIHFGVIAQTQMPNGDFESWSTLYPNNRPLNYFTIDSMGLHSCFKTPDKNGGTYATRLMSLDTTLFGFYNVKIPGMATLGKVNFNTYIFYGGIPFTDKPSNFRFYYKYLPNGTDTMMMAVYFWKYNSTLHKKDTLGGFIYYNSATISTYTYQDILIPWYPVPDVPDSMNIILLASQTVKNHTNAFFDDFSFYYEPVGIQQNLSDVLSEVYPNPAREMLNLSNEENSELSLYSVTGNLVWHSFSAQKNIKLDVSSFARGIYVLKQRNNKSVKTSKVILE